MASKTLTCFGIQLAGADQREAPAVLQQATHEHQVKLLMQDGALLRAVAKASQTRAFSGLHFHGTSEYVNRCRAM
jgi:hypothetical protein